MTILEAIEIYKKKIKGTPEEAGIIWCINYNSEYFGREIIDTLDNFDYKNGHIIDFIGGAKSVIFEKFKDMSRPEFLKKCGSAFRNWCVAYELLNELVNGGFLVYYTGSYAQDYIFTEQALKEIGMEKLFCITEKANNIFSKALARSNGDFVKVKFTNDEEENLDKLHDEFYELDCEERDFEDIHMYTLNHLNEEMMK